MSEDFRSEEEKRRDDLQELAPDLIEIYGWPRILGSLLLILGLAVLPVGLFVFLGLALILGGR